MLFRLLSRCWRGLRPIPAGAPRFILYTRRGCHLCEAAAATLARARRRHAFHLEVVDIDADPALVERHGLQVPVVTVNGKLRFRGQVNPVLLERLFR